jgi:hypothetical protein
MPLSVDREALLSLYDVPDPQRPGGRLPGYDRAHAARTTAIVLRVARRLGLPAELLERLEATALLHDLGRVGMDAALFGRIFEAAQRAGLPIRVRELVQRYPNVSKDDAANFFLELVRPVLGQQGLSTDDPRVRDHIAMRMAFDRRLKRVLQEKEAQLRSLGVTVEPWMEQVILYYYYPERMAGASETVRRMGMVLVASENFEAYNNRERARDYYGGREPGLRGAFAVLRRFVGEGLVSAQVYNALTELALEGRLDDVLKEAQGLPPEGPLREGDRTLLAELKQEAQGGPTPWAPP